MMKVPTKAAVMNQNQLTLKEVSNLTFIKLGILGTTWKKVKNMQSMLLSLIWNRTKLISKELLRYPFKKLHLRKIKINKIIMSRKPLMKQKRLQVRNLRLIK